jgi:hypothetical protein
VPRLDPGQVLDLLIARLRAALPAQGRDGAPAAPRPPGLRIDLVSPPPGVPGRKR